MALIAALAAAGALGAGGAPQARFDYFAYEGRNPANAATPAPPGTYRNPILSGFYPDPSITRSGRDFYLVNSTFTYVPGLPIFRSRDLVHWTQIGNAIDRPGQIDFKGLGLSRGLFAPDISVHGGLFYILNTCVDCGGNFLITARDPAGPWSDPVWLKTVGGIDPSLFVDADGRAYVLNNDEPPEPARYPGHRAIWIRPFDLKTMRPSGPARVLVDGGVHPADKPIWIEGPHIFRRGGWYYLTCAEGGTAEGHSEVVLRSRSVTGPYEAYAGNPILTQRDLPADRPFPVTSAGHAELVEAPDGRWWASFLATLPYQGDFYNTGRQTFLLPVAWRDGWPVILPHGAAVPYVGAAPKLPPGPAPPVATSGDFSYRDTFREAKLGPQWLSIRGPSTGWAALKGGALVLQAKPDPLGGSGEPAYLARRQQHTDASVSTRVRFVPARDGERAGLAAFQNEAFFYLLSVAREAGREVVTLQRRAGPDTPVDGVTLASAPIPAGSPVALKITARGGRYDFAYALKPGRWTRLARDQDGTVLSTKTAGGFVGATFGLYAYAPAAAPTGDRP